MYLLVLFMWKEYEVFLFFEVYSEIDWIIWDDKECFIEFYLRLESDNIVSIVN